MELLMDGSYLRRDGDVKWGAFLQSLNTCFIRISPEELHNLISFLCANDQVQCRAVQELRMCPKVYFTITDIPLFIFSLTLKHAK